ncbi:MAG TPA: hypothetical protein PLL25_09505 [Flavobacteriales bacterium]|jgi:hypothetical protein|nr:hypothetical protein [Flavobacteriales bacterium]
MSKAKAGLRGLNATDKQRRAAIILGCMSGNPHFPNPSPSMAEFGAALAELREANIAALDRGRTAILRRNAADRTISQMITRLAGYVNSICAGDLVKIASAGFQFTKAPKPISSLQAPKYARVRSTPYPSRLVVKWERVPGALIYQVEAEVTTADGGKEWQRIALTSRPKIEVDGHPSDQFHTFRICAVGTKTQSPYAEAHYFKAA